MRPPPTRIVPFVAMAGAGNTFAVVRASAAGPADARPRLARALCAHAHERVAGLPARLDGLLVVASDPGEGADVRMEVWNADGSRAAACGNGLRVVGKFAGERGAGTGEVVRVATDAGVRAVALRRAAAGRPDRSADGGSDANLGEHRPVVGAVASLGVATVVPGGPLRLGARAPEPSARSAREVDSGARTHAQGARVLDPVWVDVGNPHAVLFEPDVSLDELAELGPRVEGAAALAGPPGFADGVNVERARAAAGAAAWTVRVWERGVGETAACGSGACAVEAAARARGLVPDGVEVLALEFPGGRLTVGRSPAGESLLEGDCVELGEGTLVLALDPAQEEGVPSP